MVGNTSRLLHGFCGAGPLKTGWIDRVGRNRSGCGLLWVYPRRTRSCYGDNAYFWLFTHCHLRSTTPLPVLFDSLHGSCTFPAISLQPPEEPESWHLTELACKSRVNPTSRLVPTFTESLVQSIFLPAAILGNSSRSIQLSSAPSMLSI